MVVPLWEILNRSKDGPTIEQKQYDLALFKKTQELQKKYGINYDPAKPVDMEGEVADIPERSATGLKRGLNLFSAKLPYKKSFIHPESSGRLSQDFGVRGAGIQKVKGF